MPRLEPDHNGQRIFALASTQAVYTGEHPDEMALFQLLTTGTSSIPVVDDAYELYVHPEDRHIVSALIVGKATNEQISNALAMTQQLVAAFRHLFFDREVFRHDLDVKNFVRMLNVSAEQQALYVSACEKGFRVVANKFRIGERPPINPKEALQELLADQLDRARAHRGLKLDTEIAREALRWGQTATSTANILLRQEPQDGQNALQELKLALLTKDHTSSVDELDIQPGDLYH